MSLGKQTAYNLLRNRKLLKSTGLSLNRITDSQLVRQLMKLQRENYIQTWYTDFNCTTRVKKDLRYYTINSINELNIFCLERERTEEPTDARVEEPKDTRDNEIEVSTESPHDSEVEPEFEPPSAAEIKKQHAYYCENAEQISYADYSTLYIESCEFERSSRAMIMNDM